MSADYRQLVAFRNSLVRAQDGMTDFRKQLIVGEGVYAVKEAKKICKEERIIKTGNLRNSFHTDASPVVSGNIVRIDVHNTADYASHVEYGHIAVGKGSGTLRDRRRKALAGGKFVRGKYVLTRAVIRTLDTQPVRIGRKLDRYLKQHFGGGR